MCRFKYWNWCEYSTAHTRARLHAEKNRYTVSNTYKNTPNNLLLKTYFPLNQRYQGFIMSRGTLYTLNGYYGVLFMTRLYNIDIYIYMYIYIYIYMNNEIIGKRGIYFKTIKQRGSFRPALVKLSHRKHK